VACPLFPYEIVDDRVHVYGLFYDGMALPVEARRGAMKAEDE
jgi:hypothetical protein